MLEHLVFPELDDGFQCLSDILLQVVVLCVHCHQDFLQFFHVTHHSIGSGKQTFFFKGAAYEFISDVGIVGLPIGPPLSPESGVF
jgi:hypothetical protein